MRQTITYRLHNTGTPDISGTNEFTPFRNGFQTWENDAQHDITHNTSRGI